MLYANYYGLKLYFINNFAVRNYYCFFPCLMVKYFRRGEAMKKVEIFTDGACSGNPGPGGWGAVLRYKGTEKEISGGERNTTNNRGAEASQGALRGHADDRFKIRCRRPFKRLGKELEGKGLEEKRQQACVKSGPVGGAFKALRYPQGHRSMGQGSRLPPGKRTLRPTGCR